MEWIFVAWGKLYDNLFVVPLMIVFGWIYTKFVLTPKMKELLVKIENDKDIQNALLTNFKDIIQEYKDQNKVEHSLIVDALKELNRDVKELTKSIMKAA